MEDEWSGSDEINYCFVAGAVIVIRMQRATVAPLLWIVAVVVSIILVGSRRRRNSFAVEEGALAGLLSRNSWRWIRLYKFEEIASARQVRHCVSYARWKMNGCWRVGGKKDRVLPGDLHNRGVINRW